MATYVNQDQALRDLRSTHLGEKLELLRKSYLRGDDADVVACLNQISKQLEEDGKFSTALPFACADARLSYALGDLDGCAVSLAGVAGLLNQLESYDKGLLMAIPACLYLTRKSRTLFPALTRPENLGISLIEESKVVPTCYSNDELSRSKSVHGTKLRNTSLIDSGHAIADSSVLEAGLNLKAPSHWFDWGFRDLTLQSVLSLPCSAFHTEAPYALQVALSCSYSYCQNSFFVPMSHIERFNSVIGILESVAKSYPGEGHYPRLCDCLLLYLDILFSFDMLDSARRELERLGRILDVYRRAGAESTQYSVYLLRYLIFRYTYLTRVSSVDLRGGQVVPTSPDSLERTFNLLIRTLRGLADGKTSQKARDSPHSVHSGSIGTPTESDPQIEPEELVQFVDWTFQAVVTAGITTHVSTAKAACQSIIRAMPAKEGKALADDCTAQALEYLEACSSLVALSAELSELFSSVEAAVKSLEAVEKTSKDLSGVFQSGSTVDALGDASGGNLDRTLGNSLAVLDAPSDPFDHTVISPPREFNNCSTVSGQEVAPQVGQQEGGEGGGKHTMLEMKDMQDMQEAQKVQEDSPATAVPAYSTNCLTLITNVRDRLVTARDQVVCLFGCCIQTTAFTPQLLSFGRSILKCIDLDSLLLSADASGVALFDIRTVCLFFLLKYSAWRGKQKEVRDLSARLFRSLASFCSAASTNGNGLNTCGPSGLALSIGQYTSDGSDDSDSGAGMFSDALLAALKSLCVSGMESARGDCIDFLGFFGECFKYNIANTAPAPADAARIGEASPPGLAGGTDDSGQVEDVRRILYSIFSVPQRVSPLEAQFSSRRQSHSPDSQSIMSSSDSLPSLHSEESSNAQGSEPSRLQSRPVAGDNSAAGPESGLGTVGPGIPIKENVIDLVDGVLENILGDVYIEYALSLGKRVDALPNSFGRRISHIQRDFSRKVKRKVDSPFAPEIDFGGSWTIDDWMQTHLGVRRRQKVQQSRKQVDGAVRAGRGSHLPGIPGPPPTKRLAPMASSSTRSSTTDSLDSSSSDDLFRSEGAKGESERVRGDAARDKATGSTLERPTHSSGKEHSDKHSDERMYHQSSRPGPEEGYRSSYSSKGVTHEQQQSAKRPSAEEGVPRDQGPFQVSRHSSPSLPSGSPDLPQSSTPSVNLPSGGGLPPFPSLEAQQTSSSHVIERVQGSISSDYRHYQAEAVEEQLNSVIGPSQVQMLAGGRSLDSGVIPADLDLLGSLTYILRARIAMYPPLNGEPDLRIWYHDITMRYLVMEAGDRSAAEGHLQFRNLMALIEECAPEVFSLGFTDLSGVFLDVAHLAMAAPRLREMRVDYCCLPTGFLCVLCGQFLGRFREDARASRRVSRGLTGDMPGSQIQNNVISRTIELLSLRGLGNSLSSPSLPAVFEDTGPSGMDVGLSIRTLDLSDSSFSAGISIPIFVQAITNLILDGCESPGTLLQACIDKSLSVESVSLRYLSKDDARTLCAVPLEQLAGLRALDFRGTEVSADPVLYELVSALPDFGITVCLE